MFEKVNWSEWRIELDFGVGDKFKKYQKPVHNLQSSRRGKGEEGGWVQKVN